MILTFLNVKICFFFHHGFSCSIKQTLVFHQTDSHGLNRLIGKNANISKSMGLESISACEAIANYINTHIFVMYCFLRDNLFLHNFSLKKTFDLDVVAFSGSYFKKIYAINIPFFRNSEIEYPSETVIVKTPPQKEIM